MNFVSSLNNNDINITLTSCISDTSVDFLNLTLKLQNGKITTTMFRKPTATNSLLEYTSFHPQHLRDGILIGQFLRAKRNCSEMKDFRQHAHNLTERFQQRGFPKILSKAFQRAAVMDGQVLLQPSIREQQQAIRLVTMYNNQWSNIKRILSKHWHILNTDTRLQNITPEAPILRARRAPNLKDRLCHSHYVQTSTSLGRGRKLAGHMRVVSAIFTHT